MDKAYDPTQVEGPIYEYWMREGVLHAEVDPAKTPYCIVIPPPNVTGVLHIGHALDGRSGLADSLAPYAGRRGSLDSRY